MKANEIKYFRNLAFSLRYKKLSRDLFIDSHPLLPLQYAYVHNLKTGALDSVKGVERVLGYSEKEFTLSKYYELVHPDDREAIFETSKRNIDIVNEKKSHLTPNKLQFSIMYRMRRLSGDYAHILRQSIIIESSDQIHKTYSLCTDISGLNIPVKLSAHITVPVFQSAYLNNTISKVKHDKWMGLTIRETQVLELICRGRSSKEIASELSISLLTVNKHRQNILRKTGCKNVADLINEVVHHSDNKFVSE